VEEKGSRRNGMADGCLSEKSKKKKGLEMTRFFHLGSNVSKKLKHRWPDPYMAVFSLIGLEGKKGNPL